LMKASDQHGHLRRGGNRIAGTQGFGPAVSTPASTQPRLIQNVAVCLTVQVQAHGDKTAAQEGPQT